MLGFLASERDTTHPKVGVRDQILRFRASERHLHWALAIPFIVCYGTAMLLVTVYNPNPARPFRELVSWIHRISGLCLATMPLRMILRHRHDIGTHVDNVRRAWSWALDDIRWLFLIGPATLNARVSLPHQGKFNAAEKINFMVLTSTYPIYLATGLTIWFFRPAYLSWLIHFSLATVATPLIFGHIFMATVNPDTRVGLTGMITGFVDRHWAKHHYRLWYEELFGAEDAEAPGPAATQLARPAATQPARPAATQPPVPVVASAVAPVRATNTLGTAAPQRRAARPLAPETDTPAAGSDSAGARRRVERLPGVPQGSAPRPDRSALHDVPHHGLVHSRHVSAQGPRVPLQRRHPQPPAVPQLP